jgi:hypothetical protein
MQLAGWAFIGFAILWNIAGMRSHLRILLRPPISDGRSDFQPDAVSIGWIF